MALRVAQVRADGHRCLDGRMAEQAHGRVCVYPRPQHIDATVRQAQNVDGLMNRNQMQDQNGINSNGVNDSAPTNPVNV